MNGVKYFGSLFLWVGGLNHWLMISEFGFIEVYC